MRFAKLNKPPLSFKSPLSIKPRSKVREKNKLRGGGLIEDLRYIENKARHKWLKIFRNNHNISFAKYN